MNIKLGEKIKELRQHSGRRQEDLASALGVTNGNQHHKPITKSLPEDWPFWCNPDYSRVEKEIKADPRWDEWVKRTQE